jgi:hypothetical protein
MRPQPLRHEAVVRQPGFHRLQPAGRTVINRLKLSTGGYDALAGRYLHAEHDDVDALLERIAMRYASAISMRSG